MTTHLYVVAGLAIRNGRWNELRPRILRRADSKDDRTLPAFSRLALIFRALLNETQAQSQNATDTRDIPELGISASIPLTEYRANVANTRITPPFTIVT